MEIRKGKIKNWEKFSQDNFNQNAWGFVCTLFSEKLKTPVILGTQANQDGSIPLLAETMRKTLESLLPDNYYVPSASIEESQRQVETQ